MFAYNTALFYMSNDYDDLRLGVQSDLPSVSQWLSTNSLSVNVTKVLYGGSTQHLRNLEEMALCHKVKRI